MGVSDSSQESVGTAGGCSKPSLASRVKNLIVPILVSVQPFRSSFERFGARMEKQIMSAITDPRSTAQYQILPKTASQESDLGGELLEVAMGPQHPSTHGVFRMDVVLDGETVVKLKPVFG